MLIEESDKNNNQELKNKIDQLISISNYIMFFTLDKEVYGTDENGRITFATFKDKKDDYNNKSWREEACFLAFNLENQLSGNYPQKIIKEKDIKGIKVISAKEVKEILCSKFLN